VALPVFASTIDIGRVVTTLNNVGAINTIDDFQRQKPLLISAITDLKTHLTDTQSQIDDLNVTLTQQTSQLTAITSERDALKQDDAAKQATIDKLTAVAATTQSAAAAKPIELASAFQNVIDTMQQQSKASAGAASSVIKTLDIEIRGVVSMQSDAGAGGALTPVLLLPTPGAPIDPAQLSVLRMSFGAVPNAAAAVAAPAPAAAAAPAPAAAAPSPPAPAPAPSARTAPRRGSGPKGPPRRTKG
jgi:hypothetical protein